MVGQIRADRVSCPACVAGFKSAPAAAGVSGVGDGRGRAGAIAADRAGSARRSRRRCRTMCQPTRTVRASRRRPADPLATRSTQWKRLQQTDNLPFDNYAGFLLAHPGWPGETEPPRGGRDRARRGSWSPALAVALLPPLPAADRRRRRRATPRRCSDRRPAGEAADAARARVADGRRCAPTDESAMLGALRRRADARRSRRADGHAAVAGRDERRRAADRLSPARRAARCSRRGSRFRTNAPDAADARRGGRGAMRERRRLSSPTARPGCATTAPSRPRARWLARPHADRDPPGRCREMVRGAADRRARRGGGRAVCRSPIDIARQVDDAYPRRHRHRDRAAMASATTIPAWPGSAGRPR